MLKMSGKVFRLSVLAILIAAPFHTLMAQTQNENELVFWRELIYPSVISNTQIKSSIEDFKFLGHTFEYKKLDINFDFTLWGYSQKAIWSYVYNYDNKTVHILISGKSNFIRDPILHKFSNSIRINERVNSPDDWHKDWEIFISQEKPGKCSFHSPESFACYDWISLGKY